MHTSIVHGHGPQADTSRVRGLHVVYLWNFSRLKPSEEQRGFVDVEHWNMKNEPAWGKPSKWEDGADSPTTDS